MKALPSRFLRGYCYLHVQFILLKNWVPWCTYHAILYCGTYHVKVTCYSCFDSIFRRPRSFSSAGALRGCCGGGAVQWSSCRCCRHPVSLSSPCLIHYDQPLPSSTGTSLTILCPRREVSLSLSISLNFPWTTPCMFAKKWGSILFTTLLWCKVVDLWWWLTCEYPSFCCMCFAGMVSGAKNAIPYLLLIGTPYWFGSLDTCLG
jgi:hypothetical protein